MNLGFDLEPALAELAKAEIDDEGYARIYVGTIFSLTPSGKFYTPWACSNVRGCAGCGGTGIVRSRVSARRRKKWDNFHKIRKTWVKRYGPPANWPPRIQARSERINALNYRARTICTNCGGLGSREAYLDERWQEYVEKTLEPHGCWLESGEGDGTDLYLCTKRETGETTSDGEE